MGKLKIEHSKPDTFEGSITDSEDYEYDFNVEEFESKGKKKKRAVGQPKIEKVPELTDLTDLQRKRIKLLKDFYAGKLLTSDAVRTTSQDSQGEVLDASQPAEEADISFAQNFQISWYLNESVAFFPDSSSVPEDSFSIRRDRNLWFLYRSINNSCSNDRPLPNFPIGKQVELKHQSPNQELHLLIKHVSNGVFTTRGTHEDRIAIVEHEFNYEAMQNMAYSLQKYVFPAELSKAEAIDAFVESKHDYILLLPRGFESKNARKDLILASKIAPSDYRTTLPGMVANVSYALPMLLRNFPLNAIKIFFRRTKFDHEFRIFFDTTFLESSLKDMEMFKGLGSYYRDNLKTQLMNPELGNTLEFVPRTPAAGFNLQLYDYQKRSLQWMYQVEKKENSVSIIKRGETAHLARFDAMPDTIINFSESTLIDRPTPYYEQVDYACLGGVLADNPGYGKTITTLALIYSNPLDSFRSLPMTPVEKFFLFPSRATLIVCPANLVKQWQAEVEKCLPSSVRCYIVSWIIDHRKLSWNDVMQADIIIISVGFLANQSYHKLLKEKFNKPSDVYNERSSATEPYFAPVMRKIIPARKTLCDELGVVNFEAIYWHRIVFDEFHELDKCEKNSRGMAKAFRGLYHWGMTGTPAFKTIQEIKVSAEFLSIELDSSESSSLGRCLSFKANFIRRNNEDLQLPPLTDEIEWVNLSPPEMALYNVRSGDSEIAAFMACSHYQISDEVVSAAGDEILSIDKVSDLLCKRLIATCTQLELNIDETKSLISQVKREISRDIFDTPNDRAKAKRELDREFENLKAQQTMYNQKTRELTYFKGVMNALEKDSLDESCLICLDEMKLDNQQLCVTKCGHVFCVECVLHYMAAAYPNPKICPKCREVMKKEEIMRVDPKTHAAEKAKKPDKLADVEQLEKCGSKISAMIKRLKVVRTENPDAKIILFCQFRRLANIIYSTLTDNGVSVARVHGSHSTRSKAINEFKSDPECSVIMLSTEDSVSGLHLPEATHIFITHPFWFGSGREEVEKAISAEKQGIARAHRLGLQHPLKVIRFYTKDTIEETVSKDRSKI